jgi:ankyrin repeat protein
VTSFADRKVIRKWRKERVMLNKLVVAVVLLMSVSMFGSAADLNERFLDGQLVQAAKDGALVEVKNLLEKGASADAEEVNGMTVLMWTSLYDHKEIILVLLEAGAELDRRDDNGRTALYWAAHGGHDDVVRALLEAGADVNNKARYGDTALMAAAACGHESTVRMLVESGADVSMKNDFGWCASIMAKKNGHSEIADFLENQRAK